MLGMHLRRTAIIAIALSTIWFVRPSAQFRDTPKLDVEQAINGYLYGNSGQVATAKIQLEEAGFDAVYPYFHDVLRIESPEYLRAIQLFVSIDDERVVPVLRDYLLDVNEGMFWRRNDDPLSSVRTSMRQDVIEAIALFGYGSASRWLLSVDTQDGYYWGDVAHIFRNIEGDEATLVLIDLVQTGLSPTVSYAATALVRRRPLWAMPHLETAFKSTPSKSSRLEILKVLKELWEPEESENREFDLATRAPITDWNSVRTASRSPYFRDLLTDYQRNFLDNIEQIPECYARAIYWCHGVQVSVLGPICEGEPMWDDGARHWVDTNRDAIIGDLMRPYEMWGRIQEGSFSIYPSDAQVLAYLKATESLQWLRGSFVYSPGNRYTGEGSYPFSFSDGGAFPYHNVLGEAIEYLTGKPIAEAIQPTDEELDTLIRYVRGDSENHADRETALYRLFRLVPEIARTEALTAFRRSGPEHYRNFVITIDRFISESSPTTQEILELLGPPAEREGNEWTYKIGPAQSFSFSKGGEYKLFFSENRLMSTKILEIEWTGELVPWQP